MQIENIEGGSIPSQIEYNDNSPPNEQHISETGATVYNSKMAENDNTISTTETIVYDDSTMQNDDKNISAIVTKDYMSSSEKGLVLEYGSMHPEIEYIDTRVPDKRYISQTSATVYNSKMVENDNPISTTETIVYEGITMQNDGKNISTQVTKHFNLTSSENVTIFTTMTTIYNLTRSEYIKTTTTSSAAKYKDSIHLRFGKYIKYVTNISLIIVIVV